MARILRPFPLAKIASLSPNGPSTKVAGRPTALREDFAAGERLGRYELVATIGGGGFASVWRARSLGIGGFQREVAIKVIRQGRASLKRFQDMLLDEARLVARIQHPNVAQIWEVGEDPRSLYFVMELVDGDSLDELAMRADSAGKRLPVRAVCRVLADACAGLHAAHELNQDGQPLGLVHRDVSPQNILVSREGIAKLIDFGIAKAKERLAPDTTTGFIKGKISFMAPEQARSEDVDRRADIWAMGAVAYELIEGKPPFDANTDVGRLALLVGPTPVPPMSDRAPLPIRQVIEKSLQKDASGRYATALELKTALEEAMIESELETSTDETAALFGPYFHKRARSGSTPEAVPVAEEAHSVERAVSSTIDARPKTETIVIPRRKSYWPLAGLGLLLLPGAVWLAFSSGTEPPAQPVPAASPPQPSASATAAGAQPSAVPEPLPVAAASVSASASALAPPLQSSSAPPPKRVRPRIDPDAIE
jgi:serine/threonine protein kinase